MSFDEGVSHVIELVSYSHIKWERCPEVISCPGRHIKKRPAGIPWILNEIQQNNM